MRNLFPKLMDFIFMRFFKTRTIGLIKHVLTEEHIVFNRNGNLKIGDSSVVLNALFNLSSGNITIGNNVSFGHNVCCLSGTHNISKTGKKRQHEYPTEGNDITIEDGVWIGSNVTILGPCKIGKNSAIAASSLVNKDVPEGVLYAGVPAKFIKTISFSL